MIFEKLQEMIVQQLNLSKSDVTLASDIIKDLGADSLDIVEVLMNVEDEWDIVIDDDDIPTIKTVGDVVSCIEKKLAAK